MKHITIEKVILFLAASYAAYNFGLAGGYVEGTRISLGGLIAGIVVNMSLAIAASRYGSIKGDKRTRQARAAFITMLMLSPLLVSPVVYYHLPAQFLGNWIPRVIWSMVWPLVADLAIVLAGAVSGKGLISLGEPATQVAGKHPAIARNLQGKEGAIAVQVAGKNPAIARNLQGKKGAIARKLQASTPQLRASCRVSKEQLLTYLQGNPGASDSEIARNFGISRQAIASRRRALTPQELGLAKEQP